MIFQNIRFLHAFARHYSNVKRNFSKRFSKFSSDRITLCNNNDQIRISDTLTSARPIGVVKTLAFQARVSTTPSGVQQMLMHRKTCLIPIITVSTFITGEMVAFSSLVRRYISVRLHQNKSFLVIAYVHLFYSVSSKYTYILFLQNRSISVIQVTTHIKPRSSHKPTWQSGMFLKNKIYIIPLQSINQYITMAKWHM